MASIVSLDPQLQMFVCWSEDITASFGRVVQIKRESLGEIEQSKNRITMQMTAANYSE